MSPYYCYNCYNLLYCYNLADTYIIFHKDTVIHITTSPQWKTEFVSTFLTIMENDTMNKSILFF